MKIKHYFWNCFLLLLPVFLWNIVLVDSLPKGYGPDFFDKDVPKFVVYSENFLRVILFVFPAVMMLSLKTKIQKVGFLIYLLGLVLYFSSWAVMIVFPESNWSQSQAGFMAPAYTTLIWFVGIGIIGNKSFFKIPYLTVIYIVFSVLFVVVHTLHAALAFQGL